MYCQSAVKWNKLQSGQVKRTHLDYINETIIQRLNSLVDGDLVSSLHSCICNKQWIHMWSSHEISASSVFLNLVLMSLKQFYPFWPNTEELSWKSLLITYAGMQIWIWDRYVAMTNGWIFQIHNSLMQSWGGGVTLYCKVAKLSC